MTTAELCRTAGLTERELQNWIDNGLLDAERVGGSAGGGVRTEFTADQAERARVIKALQSKGAKLSQLARADLAGLAGKAFVVFDCSELRACRDAAAAIAAVVKARRWCSAVDLSTIRTSIAE
jgi:lambda repressor-like predicted transcriptional regulator